MQPQHDRNLAWAQRFSWQGITVNDHTLEVWQIKESTVSLIFPASSLNRGILGVRRILCFLVGNSSTTRRERLCKVSSPPCSTSVYNQMQRPKYLDLDLNVTQQTALAVAFIHSYSFNLFLFLLDKMGFFEFSHLTWPQVVPVLDICIC